MKKLLFILISLLLIIGLIAGCSKTAQQQDTPQTAEEQQEQQPQFVEKEIVLFYPDAGNNYLLHEFRKITVNQDIAGEDMVKLVLEELVKGTDNSELKPIIPRDAKILTVELDDPTVTVDFSKNFLAMDYSAKEKQMQVYSVVNTLSELDIEKVNILIEGKAIEEYYTSLKEEMPFIRDDELFPSK